MGFSFTFNPVPFEVVAVESTGIFDFNYTHVSSDTARAGIQKTGKIMAPRVALAHDVVGFSGEAGDVAFAISLRVQGKNLPNNTCVFFVHNNLEM